ncbi:hypothetical protein [Moorena sp. SIO4G3]|nr:hypothetical protein [Moorena sp. SIO4G3]NEO77863.1 hypothetical protein [Moorena sp. SIO4G3]
MIIVDSLLTTPYSLLPTPYSLLPTPFSMGIVLKQWLPSFAAIFGL